MLGNVGSADGFDGGVRGGAVQNKKNNNNNLDQRGEKLMRKRKEKKRTQVVREKLMQLRRNDTKLETRNY